MQKGRRMANVFIIAEAGVNHNGKIEMAKKLIDVAVMAGVNAVKFQTFKTESLVAPNAPKAEYQKKATDPEESQFDMLKKLELDFSAHQHLLDYCQKKEILFLSTPFDLESIDLLNQLGIEIFKIPSGEITNYPYLKKIGGLGKKIIMSTGMASLSEIGDALTVLINAGTPKEKISVLHCTTQYPTPVEDVNLRAMDQIAQAYDVEIGYSDHTLGIHIPVAAVSRGATIIEKHITLDCTLPGPDHKASLEPQPLKEMVAAIRDIEKALGDGIKAPATSEQENLLISRKSLVAARAISKGELYSAENLAVRRPGSGINPMRWEQVIGQRAKCDFSLNELIEV